MYSKDMGITRRDADLRRPFVGAAPIYRQSQAKRVQVPPNYSGHAIVDGEERPLGSGISSESESPRAPAPFPAPDTPMPRFDDLPRVSELGDPHRHGPRALPAAFSVRSDSTENAFGARSDPTENAFSVRPDPTGNPFSVRPDPAEAAYAADTPLRGSEASAEPTPPAPSPIGRRTSRAPSLLESARLSLARGIGGEELLVLGLILLLLHEGGDCEERGDLDETVILLGLLLLLG